MTTNGMKGVLAFALGVLAASGCGDGAKGDCPALDSCGGNPAGTWTHIADACQFQAVRPAQPVDVMAFGNITPPSAMIAPPQPNPVVLQQTTSGDWCSNLVFTDNDAVSNVALWHDAPLVTGASITLLDGSYLTELTFSTAGFPQERNTTHFAPRCLAANGAVAPTCDKLKTALIAFYGQTAVPSAKPNFQQINCTGDAATTGCDCTYTYNVTVSDQGMWTVQGDTLLQDSANGAFTYNGNGTSVGFQSPSTTLKTTFCAQGGTLQLTGLRGGSLFGILGLRTLMLSP